LITGGGGAIGGAQALLFAREGAAVVVADLTLEKAVTVAKEVASRGGKATAVGLDVRNGSQWAEAIGTAERTHGPVTILCNNAGANVRVGFDEQTEEQWHLILETILTGSFLGIKAVVPSMRRAGHGVIVNLGSLASIRPAGGSPAYAASKTGLVALTRCAAAEFARDAIRCVLVSPGHVDTPFIREDTPYSPNDERTSISNPAGYARRLGATPLGRLQTPDDVAGVCLFAVSDDAAMVTGSMLTVDGGAAL
jgi:NAD(P)-dependent dehydrogenase (short-subunit alcohol dehydrogenase family)